MSESIVVCDHGRLKRKCEICELIECEAENTALRAKLSALDEHFENVTDLGIVQTYDTETVEQWLAKARAILKGE